MKNRVDSDESEPDLKFIFQSRVIKKTDESFRNFYDIIKHMVSKLSKISI